jgi:hypothetical protein
MCTKIKKEERNGRVRKIAVASKADSMGQAWRQNYTI